MAEISWRNSLFLLVLSPSPSRSTLLLHAYVHNSGRFTINQSRYIYHQETGGIITIELIRITKF